MIAGFCTVCKPHSQVVQLLMAKTQHTRPKGRLFRKRGRKTGTAPGTLVHIGEVQATDTQIKLIAYNRESLQEQSLQGASDCCPPANGKPTAWYNIDGLQNPDVIRTIGENFTLHPLVMEDILNTDHRPKIEVLEDELINHPVPGTLTHIHHFKREMLLLRKAIWPLREVLSSLSRDENVVMSSEIRVFLRDVYDHSIHIMDNIETLRDLLGGMLDLYVSRTSQRMNEIMKVLTIFASIFMPLTFIAGVYGMNFENMPELEWTWGYFGTLFFMATVGIGLLAYFRWRKWL